ncbi:hypothetical protein SO802_008803 [Lithocarpus litseifolius]|uniref:Uncharacterized protein n=1 Tax=Lithocarpus litseifolius TaxID=425828 RepID=A0AAW2DAA9_9ROSI
MHMDYLNRRRVGARVLWDEGQNLKFRRSVDVEAESAARVPRRRPGNHESEAARGRFPGENCGAWRRVAMIWVTGILGYGRGRSWSTSVVLVSSGEAWICADLRLMSRVCLSLWILDTALSQVAARCRGV